MNYTLAVFQTRFSTLSFANILRENNIPFAVINTPRGLGRACGISIKFLSDFFYMAEQLLGKGNIRTNFYGFFEYVYDGRGWNWRRK